MEVKEYHPGELVKDLVVVAGTEDGKAFHLAFEDGEEPLFYLHPSRLSEKSPPHIGEKLKGPFVILDRMGNLFEIAQKDYYYELNMLFSNHIGTIPWKTLWKSAYGEDLKPKCQTRKADKKGNRWEVRLPSAVAPVKASRYIQWMKGQHYFRPIHMELKRDYGVYKPQTQNLNWPIRYDCEIEIHQPNGIRTVRNVNLLLHAILDPLKFHYNIRKHMAGDPRANSFPKSREHWNRWSGMAIGKDIRDYFSNCRECAEKAVRCSPECPADDFKSTNNEIYDLFEAYLTKGVTLLLEHSTNSIYIAEKNDPDIVSIFMDCDDFVTNNGKKDTFVRMHLRGESFNWADPVPTLHMHIITLFSGEHKKKNQSSGYQKHKAKKTIRLKKIKEVK